MADDENQQDGWVNRLFRRSAERGRREMPEVPSEFAEAIAESEAVLAGIGAEIDALENPARAENDKALQEWAKMVDRLGAVDFTLLDANPITSEDIAAERLNPKAVFALMGKVDKSVRPSIMPLAEQFLETGLGNNAMAKYAAIRAVNDLPAKHLQELGGQQEALEDWMSPAQLMTRVGARITAVLGHEATGFAFKRGVEAHGDGHPLADGQAARLLRERQQPRDNGQER